MALGKTTTNPKTGAVRSYVRIDNVNMPNLIGGGKVKVGYYVDAIAAATLAPDGDDELTLTPTESAMLRAGGLALLYSILKARPEFADATDV